MHQPDQPLPEAAIAIIGMACRYPGAENIQQFWENLRGGIESITHFSPDELEDEPDRITAPNYVPARGIVKDADLFDAPLFGLTPREASVMDPQHRIFLQTALACLEDAGYDPELAGQALGLFAGTDPSAYEHDIRTRPALSKTLDHLQILIGNALGFFTTRVSYLLNLRGPSVPVQTTCSTSLTAIHLACQSLLGFESDMALAGGSSIPTPIRAGHLYVPDGPLSPDGICRTFDSKAEGTALGSGAGVVLLKRLEDAVEDRDHIYAVIRGSAFNNDGSAKVGFTAPSVEGQRRVITEAMAVAGVEPQSISFVESHGTATKLGDPIEVEALRQAFGKLPAKSCVLGALKTNIGHCNAAAGVAGLIKTALCIKHRTLVPNLNFETPNPELQLETSPFTILTEAQPWQAPEILAGVSAFGLGGTNVHAILGEAPPAAKSQDQQGPFLLTISAKSESALVRKRIDLQENLKNQPPASLADWVFTLNVGRKDWDIRQSLVFDDQAGALEALADRHALKPNSHTNKAVFLFPGQGAAYPDFGATLYGESNMFRQTVDQCCDLLAPQLGLDLKDLMFSQDPEMRKQLEEPRFWQPAIFVCEYALAQCWNEFGVQPEALMGHSIGEYVAATIAGIFQLEQALQLIALRGRETQKLSGGAMLAVIAFPEKVAPYLSETIELAAENGPSLQILAGPAEAIESVRKEMVDAGLQTILLPSNHAFHSEMMVPLMAPIRDFLANATLNSPKIPIVSNLSGTWLSGEEACDPNYWARHTRGTVRFNSGLETLFQDQNRVFLEIGPGQVLTKIVSRHPEAKFGAVASTNKDDQLSLMNLWQALGSLWEEGMPLDWEHLYSDQQRARLSLPTYPFDGHRYWIMDEDPGSQIYLDPLRVRKPTSEWYYQPSWRQATSLAVPAFDSETRWLVFCQADSTSAQLVEVLRNKGAQIISVFPGDAFQKQSESHFTMPFEDHQGYAKLLQNLMINDFQPEKVVFEVPMIDEKETANVSESILKTGFNACLHWAQAMDSHAHQARQSIYFITHRLQDFGNQAPLQPLEGAVLGAAWVIPKEMPQLHCKVIDIDPANDREALVQAMLDEMLLENGDCDQVLLRAGSRWEPHFQATTLPESQTKLGENPLIVLGNGLQPLGLALAQQLSQSHGARVILLDRAFFPPEEEWDSWIQDQGEQDPISQFIQKLREMDRSMNQITIRQVQLENSERLNKVLEEITTTLGPIHGYIHLEAPMEPGLIQTKAAMAVSRLLASRVREVMALEQLVIKPEFLVLFAENLGETGMGRAEQAGLHTFSSHFARVLREKGLPAKTIEWGTHKWASSEETGHGSAGTQKQLAEKRDLFGMSIEECSHALLELVGLACPRMIVSTRDFPAVLEQQRQFTAAKIGEKTQATSESGHHPRPDLSTDLIEPRNEVEQLLADVWRSYFDIEVIGVEDNFFELGGHSLLAVQLLAKINETFAAQLSMQVLFDAPTVAGLAAALTEKDMAEDDENLAELLDEIEGLSEEELKKLLEAETAS